MGISQEANEPAPLASAIKSVAQTPIIEQFDEFADGSKRFRPEEYTETVVIARKDI